jgi:hypothetical protein
MLVQTTDGSMERHFFSGVISLLNEVVKLQPDKFDLFLTITNPICTLRSYFTPNGVSLICTQHSQQTDFHDPGGIRNHNLSRRACADIRFRPRGHWDRPLQQIPSLYISSNKYVLKLVRYFGRARILCGQNIGLWNVKTGGKCIQNTKRI